MTQDDGRLRLAVRALAVVLELDDSQLRPDTPLVGIGADSVAIIACADVLTKDLAERGLGVLDDGALRRARTVGELAGALPARALDGVAG